MFYKEKYPLQQSGVAGRSTSFESESEARARAREKASERERERESEREHAKERARAREGAREQEKERERDRWFPGVLGAEYLPRAGRGLHPTHRHDTPLSLTPYPAHYKSRSPERSQRKYRL